MSNRENLPFDRIYLVDFEFQQPDGENPKPVCMVSFELYTKELRRIWREELTSLKECPLNLGERSLYVSFYSIAEISCHLALNWKLPINSLDLYPEFRSYTNGKDVPEGNGLLGALSYFGHPAIDSAHKEALRKLIITKNTWNDEEKKAILDYCESDVRSLIQLLGSMIPHIDLPQALFRAEYMKALTGVERRGIPLDIELLNNLEKNAPLIRERLINEVNREHLFFENGIFKKGLLEQFVANEGIPWPRLESGALCCDDDTFKEMAETYGGILPLLRDTRSILSKMRRSNLTIGQDERNRCRMSPFQSSTGRNQPSNSKYIFGQPAYKRRAIKAPRGKALIYIDWSQQEFGIAAALSGDEAMKAAYNTADPYLEFAKQARAVPQSATKTTHKKERDQFKACALAVLYGMEAQGLANRIRQPKFVAERLLRLHRETYPRFWSWSDANVDRALSVGELSTVLGWKLHVTQRHQKEINSRSIRNFPMQANAAEMMRVALILAERTGLEVCATIHDAFLNESDEFKAEEHAQFMQDVMRVSSSQVLGGFELRSEVIILNSGDSYNDPRGEIIWSRIADIVESTDATKVERNETPAQSILSN